MKTIQDCIRFAYENWVGYMATIDHGKPRVRAMGFWFGDETGFYFQTNAVKNVYRQLKENPYIEVCFSNHGEIEGPMLRLSGKIEFTDDYSLKKKVIEDWPFLETFGLTIDNPNLVLFRMPHGEALFWTGETDALPQEPIIF